MKTLGLVNGDGIYTNLGLLLSEQCTPTIKAATFQGADPVSYPHLDVYKSQLCQPGLGRRISL